jgi:Fe-S cluster assembly ATP-binding protein
MSFLEISDLELSVGGNTVLDGLSLQVGAGEIHALIGRNGVGKSSLAKAIAGCQGYEVRRGDILIGGESVIGKSPDEISRRGFFLAFQNPIEIPGVSVANFIRAAIQARLPKSTPFNAVNFYKNLCEKMELLKIDKSFTSRALNDGFSGGERKRFEILQMMMLEPRCAVLDEIDSGLDVDALKVVSSAVNGMRNGNFSAIVITHHNKLLDYIKPDFVHIISSGKIAVSGGIELIEELEKYGYEFLDNGEKN